MTVFMRPFSIDFFLAKVDSKGSSTLAFLKPFVLKMVKVSPLPYRRVFFSSFFRLFFIVSLGILGYENKKEKVHVWSQKYFKKFRSK